MIGGTPAGCRLMQPPGLVARGVETGRFRCQFAIATGAGSPSMAEDTVADLHTLRPSSLPCLVTGLGHGPVLSRRASAPAGQRGRRPDALPQPPSSILGMAGIQPGRAEIGPGRVSAGTRQPPLCDTLPQPGATHRAGCRTAALSYGFGDFNGVAGGRRSRRLDGSSSIPTPITCPTTSISAGSKMAGACWDAGWGSTISWPSARAHQPQR